MFKNSLVALITPFTKDGAMDFAVLEKLLAFHAEAGTSAVVPCGTTGESATLSEAEHQAVVEFCVKHSRVPVLAGTGSNNTAEAITLTRHAAKAGAAAALLITPYYNRPTQDGLYAHFRAIHEAADIPIILYDVPSRTGVRLEEDTVCRLAELPRVVGLKDATNDLARPLRLRRRLGPDFALLSGEDVTALAFRIQGGDGCISVTANLAPKQCAGMHAAWSAGDLATAMRLNSQLLPLSDALFVETNPGPVKAGAELLGLCSGALRLPLVEPKPSTRALVKEALDALA